jgi:hypothetical protein
MPRVAQRGLNIFLQLLDHARNFGILQTFLAKDLEPICYNKRGGKEGHSSSYFLEKYSYQLNENYDLKTISLALKSHIFS